MRLLRPAWLAAILAVGLSACENTAPAQRVESKPFLPPAKLLNATGLSGGELSEATKLYTAKCAKCHKFYNPAAYNDAEWRSWMAKMSKKVRLKPNQEQLLSRYLDAFRAAEGR
jgi:cytochrome c5